MTAIDDMVRAALRSSVSDEPGYLDACRAAASDDAEFAQFKRHPDYRRVLEHVTEAQGAAYLAEIVERHKWLLRYVDEIKKNDRLGSPVVHHYPQRLGARFGHASPTTLRYAFVAAELEDYEFDSVVEVGGGYGGQCFVLKVLRPGLKYTIVDLPEPLALAEKYLTALGAAGNVTFAPMHSALARWRSSDLSPRVGGPRADLFLSNFALTECVPDVLHRYMEIAKRCLAGYVTGNAQLDLLQRLLPEARFEEERPQTAPGNFVMRWP